MFGLFLSYHLPILALALFLSALLLLDIISHYICILFFYIRCLIFIFGSFSAFLLCASISTFFTRLLSLFLSYHLPILALALFLSALLLLDIISHYICILFSYIRCLIFIFGSLLPFYYVPLSRRLLKECSVYFFPIIYPFWHWHFSSLPLYFRISLVIISASYSFIFVA